MINFKDLINKLDSFDSDTYWFGPTAFEQIQALEQKLNLKFPHDFIKFLEICGGGGADSAEISGIYKNDALREDGGTLLYSTLHSREAYELPPKLAVIFLHDDGICWAINCEEKNFGEVVSYNIFTKKVEKTLNKSFSEFFEEYVNLRITED